MSSIYERRKQRLREILRDDCEGKQAILCERLGKPPYWLDGVEDNWWPFKNIPLDLIRKLPPEKRDQLEQSILSTLSLIS